MHSLQLSDNRFQRNAWGLQLVAIVDNGELEQIYSQPVQITNNTMIMKANRSRWLGLVKRMYKRIHKLRLSTLI